MKSKDLSLDDILSCNDTKVKRVYVEKWGGNVYIKQLTGYEQDKFEQESRNTNGTPNLTHMRARLVAAALCDKDGKRLITGTDTDIQSNVAKLSLKSGAALNYLIDEISDLNRITQEDLETIAKN